MITRLLSLSERALGICNTIVRSPTAGTSLWKMSYTVAAIFSTVNDSTTSPILISENRSNAIPHSSPFLTSLTSSLKRRREPIRPSCITTPSRTRRACASPYRLMIPSVTIPPPAVPNFGTLKVSLISACPNCVSFVVGSRSPAMAFLSSSVMS